MLFQETYKFINGKDHKNWVDRKRKERISSLLRFRYLLTPMGRRSRVFSGKVSLCASFLKKASFAVETALVLPVFFLGMVNTDFFYGYLSDSDRTPSYIM